MRALQAERIQDAEDVAKLRSELDVHPDYKRIDTAAVLYLTAHVLEPMKRLSSKRKQTGYSGS